MISSSDILKASILIVDDQQADVSLLERALRGAGFTSIASTMNPGEVCELHRKNHYALILLDLQMPEMDGFQVMEGLKAIETEGYLSVLVFTAHPTHKLRALKTGASTVSLVEVKEGVAEGDAVALPSDTPLAPGARVSPVMDGGK